MNLPRVLVTGSRNWTNRTIVENALIEQAKLLGPFVLVHGDARGADRIAASITKSAGSEFQVEAHPANWSLGKAAGVLRNQEMVELGAVVCLAFPLPESRGTWDMVRRCEAAGIRVVFWG